MTAQFSPVAQWLAEGRHDVAATYDAYRTRFGRPSERLKQSRDERQLLPGDSLEQSCAGMVIGPGQSRFSLLSDLVQKAFSFFGAQGLQRVEKGFSQGRGGCRLDLPVLGFVFHFSISKGASQPQESLSPGGGIPRRLDDGAGGMEVGQ